MNIAEIGSFAERAHDHADGWRRIVAASTVATIFQTWKRTSAWWRRFGRGRRLWALCFVDNGETVGYPALFLPARPALVRTARFVGTGISDCPDPIAAPGREGAVAEAFCTHLMETRRRWDCGGATCRRPKRGSSGALAGRNPPKHGRSRRPAGARPESEIDDS